VRPFLSIVADGLRKPKCRVIVRFVESQDVVGRLPPAAARSRVADVITAV